MKGAEALSYEAACESQCNHTMMHQTTATWFTCDAVQSIQYDCTLPVIPAYAGHNCHVVPKMDLLIIAGSHTHCAQEANGFAYGQCHPLCVIGYTAEQNYSYVDAPLWHDNYTSLVNSSLAGQADHVFVHFYHTMGNTYIVDCPCSLALTLYVGPFVAALYGHLSFFA